MIVSPDIRGTVDQPTFSIVKDIKTDVPIVPFNFFNDYQFNPNLKALDKWILVDMGEYGANQWTQEQTHIWGKNSELFNQSNNDECKKFDEFVASNPPLVYFKRELLKKDASENILPIDFPCFHPPRPIETKEQFEARRFSVFNAWGYSHELRRMFQGYAYINAVQKDHCIIDNLEHLEHEKDDHRQKWISVFTPWYRRYDMRNILDIQGKCKLSVSLPGAGIKCFRHSEASLNSTMVMREDKLAWSYEWEHNKNCIKFSVSDDMNDLRGLNGAQAAIDAIEEAIRNPNLYEIYCECVRNVQNYMLSNYTTNYLQPIIDKYVH